MMSGICYEKAKSGDRFEIGKIVAIILISCLVNKNMPIVKASQHLDEDLGLVLKQIVEKIHVDKKLLQDPLFFEEIFKHQFSESSSFFLIF